MTTRILAVAPLAMAFSLATPAHAEDAAAEGAAIIVIGHGDASIAEQEAAATPGGTDVVAYEDFADRTVISLRDALAFSPGVYTQPRFGQEVRISIRGSGLSRTLPTTTAISRSLSQSSSIISRSIAAPMPFASAQVHWAARSMA